VSQIDLNLLPVNVTVGGVAFRVERRNGDILVTIGTNLKLELPLTQADGFLKTLFGSAVPVISLEAELTWSSSSGAALGGLPGTTFLIPLNKSLGIVELKTLTLQFEAAAGGFTLIAGLRAKGALGPIVTEVENLGATIELKPGAAANLRQLTTGFHPPDGAGLAINAGPVSGGGFLSLKDGRYSAVLEVSLFGIGVKAFALLDTNVPGGFSFLLLLFADFEAIGGIQLSFGFVLTGVGGIFGIFRTMNSEALSHLIRNGQLDHILFPKDPVGNAGEIISNLQDIFPPAPGEFVFGPVAKLGWGTPVVIEAVLGFVLAVPRGVVALLGQLSVYLPIKPTPVAEIHIDVGGILDIGNASLSLDGSLHDSRLVTFTLSGQMAFLLTWGRNPNFLFSVGGFNPHFLAPPGMQGLQRLTLEMGFGNPRISAQAYLAITSNTFQFGARCDLYAEYGPAEIHGWVEFDALFIISPLYFIIDLGCGVELSVFGASYGVHLNATLTGPRPWHAYGRACVSLVLKDVCVPFDVTVGSDEPASVPPPPDIAGLLSAAISDPKNWSAVLPPAGVSVATIAPPAGDTNLVLLDPLGGARFRERIVPLNRQITKFAETKLANPVTFNLGAVTAGGPGGAPVSGLNTEQDFFAVGQFQELNDDQKLSQESFTPMVAGFSIASNAARAGDTGSRLIAYETDYFEEENGLLQLLGVRRLYFMPQALQSLASATGPIASSALAPIGDPVGPRAVQFAEPSYSVASTEDLTARADIARATSRSAAYEALSQHLAGNPSAGGAVQVISSEDAVF
jgi:uncharacterized protein DUF6603